MIELGGDRELDDELFWAAAELFIGLDAATATTHNPVPRSVPTIWSNV